MSGKLHKDRGKDYYIAFVMKEFSSISILQLISSKRPLKTRIRCAELETTGPFRFLSFNDDSTIKNRIYECWPGSHSIFVHDSRLSFLSGDLEKIALLFVRKQDSKLDTNRLSGITRAASKISCLRYLHLIRSHTFAGIPKRLRQISINYRYVSRISCISSFAYWDKL